MTAEGTIEPEDAFDRGEWLYVLNNDREIAGDSEVYIICVCVYVCVYVYQTQLSTPFLFQQHDAV